MEVREDRGEEESTWETKEEEEGPGGETGLHEMVTIFERQVENEDVSAADSDGEDQQLLEESDEVEVDIVTLDDTRGEETKGKKKEELKKDISLVSMVAMVFGGIIGSGIFFTPSIVLEKSGSFGVSLIVWSLGALLAVAGGLCYCELALLMKNSGGDYWYLKKVYQFGQSDKSPVSLIGAVIAFLYVWTSVFILRPASLAIICRVFGLYLATAIAGGNDPPQASAVMIAVAAIMFLAILNCFNVKLVSRVMTVLSFAKLVAIAFIVILGLWQLIVGDHITNFTQSFSCTSTNPGDIALAFYALLWSYNGWNVVGLSVEEVKNENRNLPLGIIIGIPIVAVCYILVNIAFFAGLSRHEIVNTQSIGSAFGGATLGKAGLIVIPLLVCTSAIGAANGDLYLGSRLIFSIARDGSLPEALSGLHVKQKTPIASVLFLMTAATVYAVSGNVSSLVNSFSAAVWIFYGLNFAGIIILRITERNRPRPFKVWLPIPIIMVLVSIHLVLLPVILVPEERVSSFIAFGVILLGLPGYFFLGWSRLRPRFLNRISEITTINANYFCNASSAREN